jgi:YVTN family beta-propeller protein
MKNALRIVFLLVLGICFVGHSAHADQTYTLDADFDQGTLQNVNHDPPSSDRLELNAIATPFPFINIAASGRGTIVRIDTEAGAILGEYRTAPEGRDRNPTRTAVDLFGNVWASNSDESGLIDSLPHGSVVKIGLITGGERVNSDGTPNPEGDYLAPPFAYSTCVDRDADGLIKTSRGLDDILSWPDITDGDGGPDGLVEDAEDECILCYQRLPDAEKARHVSVDANNDLWVAGYPLAPRYFHRLDGETAAILDSFDASYFGCGGYSGFIDDNGILWSASLSQSELLRYDPSTDDGICIPVSLSYGLGLDTEGFVWNTMWMNNTVVKIAPDGEIEPDFPKPSDGSGIRGVTVTPVDNHVWVANSSSNTVSRLDNDGNVLKTIPVGRKPTGVAVDASGKVWVTNLDARNAMRIDPNGDTDALGAVDLTVSLGSLANPENLGGMTGLLAVGTSSIRGTWTVIHDSGTLVNPWDTITWNTEPEGSEPPGTRITVDARSADSEAGLSRESFVPVSNGMPLSLVGQFIEIRAILEANGEGVSPVLSDLTVKTLVEPIPCDIDEDGDVDILDIRAIFDVTNTPASGPEDPRDWDGDGMITVLDARGCVLECTNPRCTP